MAEASLTRPSPPSMIGIVARKEFTETLRDGRFKWTAAIMALLLLTALASGWQRYAAYAEMQAAAQGTSNTQWLKQGDKNPHSAAHYGNYAFKQAGSLSFFDSGIEPYTGNLLFMEAHKQNLAISRPANDMSAVTRFGEINGATILQILMPLLIIFLGFAAFAGERERGTLRQLMSMGVSRQELMWGKALGIGGAAMLAIVPCLAVGTAVLAALDVSAAPDLGARVGVLALAYGAYGLIFLFLTLGVSALLGAPRNALIVLVGFWAFSVFLAPKTAAEISKLVHPSPSLGEFQAEMKADQVRGLDGVPTAAKFGKYVRELMAQYNVESPMKLPMYFPALRMQKLEEFDHVVFDHHYNSLRDTYMAQRRLQDALGVFAPVLPLTSASMGLAGSDLLHHDTYTQAAESHRRLMVERMNGYLSKAAVDLNGVSNSSNYMTADEEVFAIVPPFAYAPPDVRAVLAEYGGGLGLLFAWLLAALGFALFAASRFRLDVR
ncbi:MAG: ABC transporter permease subunit [Rhodospirillaceae bacterium]|nr:ABC transporter permease subunit [Rhodospirillaceae bacterium]